MSNNPNSVSLFSHTVAPRPAASASLGNLLEMQVLWPHPRSAESDSLGAGPAMGSTSPPGDSKAP